MRTAQKCTGYPESPASQEFRATQGNLLAQLCQYDCPCGHSYASECPHADKLWASLPEWLPPTELQEHWRKDILKIQQPHSTSCPNAHNSAPPQNSPSQDQA